MKSSKGSSRGSGNQSRPRYRDYYIWSETRPEETRHGPTFPDQEENVWTYDEVADAYYYHRFYHFQPSLEISNRHVQDEIELILDFCLSFEIA